MRGIESEGREGWRERKNSKLISLPCTVESGKEEPQYKSLLDLPYLSRELTEKLDEYPNRPKSHTQRATMRSSQGCIQRGGRTGISPPQLEFPPPRIP